MFVRVKKLGYLSSRNVYVVSGGNLQGEEDERLRGLLQTAMIRAGRGVASAIMPVIVLGGEDKSCQPPA